MIKALKATMTAYGIGGAVFGLFYLLAPDQASEMQSQGVDAEQFMTATKMALGAGIFGAGTFSAIAARDPMKNILWVRFSIVNAALFLSVALYSGSVLYGSFGPAMVGILLHGIFGLALLLLYPRGGGQDPQTST